MAKSEPIRVEGMTADEVLALPPEEVRQYISDGAPLVLQVGTAQVLAKFITRRDELTVVLAHIDGGGEGVLRLLHKLVHRQAERDKYCRIRWIVTAVHCANPNPKLRPLLDRMGFTEQATPLGAA